MTDSGPVPFVPWGTARESREEVKTKHNEKAPTFHETLEVGVKDAGTTKIFHRPSVKFLREEAWNISGGLW